MRKSIYPTATHPARDSNYPSSFAASQDRIKYIVMQPMSIAINNAPLGTKRGKNTAKITTIAKSSPHAEVTAGN